MSTIYCLNPHCENPINDTKTRKCRSCGWDLILHKRYVAIKKIGKGGFGTTYLAVDMGRQNSYCVIKQLEPATSNPEAFRTALELFNREAKTLAKLEHPQIPKLLDYFEENQQFYLIQEFILGKNLEAEVKKEGFIPKPVPKPSSVKCCQCLNTSIPKRLSTGISNLAISSGKRKLINSTSSTLGL